jgi:hypothetical protein
MVWTAGFDDVEEKARFRQVIGSSDGSTVSIPHVVIHARGRV